MANYPIEYADLKVGDVLSTNALESMLKCKRNSDEFQFGCMSVKEAIERARPDMYWVIDHKTLRALTAPEALSHNLKSTRSALAALVRHGDRINTRVDSNKLSSDERIVHERAVSFHGNLTIQAIGERRKLAILSRIRESKKLTSG